MDFSVKGNTLSTDIFTITFENLIEKVLTYENIFVVLISISDQVGMGRILGTIYDNIYGITDKGSILWRISSGDVPSDTYNHDNAFVNIYLDENNRFHAHGFFAGDSIFDPKTGRMLSRKSGSW